MWRTHTEQPVVITTAQESSDAEFDRRRKRYAIMMGIRALCVLGAALTYHLSFILAMVFVFGGVVLPWCAVLIANDGPPRKHAEHVDYRGQGAERGLPAGSDERTVDG